MAVIAPHIVVYTMSNEELSRAIAYTVWAAERPGLSPAQRSMLDIHLEELLRLQLRRAEALEIEPDPVAGPS